MATFVINNGQRLEIVCKGDSGAVLYVVAGVGMSCTVHAYLEVSYSFCDQDSSISNIADHLNFTVYGYVLTFTLQGFPL